MSAPLPTLVKKISWFFKRHNLTSNVSNIEQLADLLGSSGGGGSPNFNLDIQTFAFENNEGIPILYNGGLWGDMFGEGETSFFPFPIYLNAGQGALLTFILDRSNCDSKIVIEATGVYVTDMIPESGTSWTVPAKNSIIATYIGFQSAGLKEVTFVATGCGVSKSVTLFFNVEEDSSPICGMSSLHYLNLTGDNLSVVFNSELNQYISSYDAKIVLIPSNVADATATEIILTESMPNVFPIADLDPFNQYNIGIFYRDANDPLCSWCNTYEGYILSIASAWLNAKPCACEKDFYMSFWVDGKNGDIYMDGPMLYKEGRYGVKGTIAPIENPLAVTIVNDSEFYGKIWWGDIEPSPTETYLITLTIQTSDGCEYCLSGSYSLQVDTVTSLKFINCGSGGSGGSGSKESKPIGGEYLKSK